VRMKGVLYFLPPKVLIDFERQIASGAVHKAFGSVRITPSWPSYASALTLSKILRNVSSG